MSATNLIDKVKAKFGELVIDSHNFCGDQTVTVKNESTVELFEFLRDDPNCHEQHHCDANVFCQHPDSPKVVWSL